MKKLIVTSATVLFIGLTAYAQDGGTCAKNCNKKCDPKECMKDGTCTKKGCMDDAGSKKSIEKNGEKKDTKAGDIK